MIKTEYRILPYQTFIADLYLQFKSIERKKMFFGGYTEKEVWRFVPCDDVCKVLGYYLREEACPTYLPFSSENYFIHDFVLSGLLPLLFQSIIPLLGSHKAL